MGEKVTNSVILQAILELSEQQKALSARVEVLSDQLAVTEQRLSHKIAMVGNKIELVSNRLLETEADVKMLKEQH